MSCVIYERKNKNMDNYNKLYATIRKTDLLNYDEKNELRLYLMNLQSQVKKQKKVIDKAIKYIETCNPNVELYSAFLDESYLSNYGAKELLDILKEVSE